MTDSAATPLPADGIHLLQITDTHLFADPQGRLLGVDTLRTLDEVVATAEAEGRAFDAVLATGDLVHDGSPAGYDRLCERLARFGRPILGLPGNHDDPSVMERHMGRPPFRYLGAVLLGSWRIVLLDSTVPGEDAGRLSATELARLEDSLSAEAASNVLVCLHHAPLTVGSAWLDTMTLQNGEAFFAVLDRCPRVRGVVFGHIHQDYVAARNGVRLLAAPSTCVQFAPGRSRFALDHHPPGYRWITLTPDGSIHTEVRRLAGTPTAIDLDAAGY